MKNLDRERWCASVSDGRAATSTSRAWRLNVVWLCLTLPRLASAQPNTSEAQPVRVHYQEDAGARWRSCFSHQEVREAVSRGLKREVFAAPEASHVVVSVRPQSEWVAEIRLSDPEGRSLGIRKLVATTCEDLAQLVSFTLTVMLDFRSDEVEQRREAAAVALSSEVGAEATEQQPQATPPVSEQPKPPAAPASVASRPSRGDGETPASVTRADSVALSPAVGAVLDSGLTPAPLFGAYAELALLSEVSSVRGAVRLKGEHMPQVTRAPGEFDAWRVSSSIHGCLARRASASWSYAACLGVAPDVTWVRASGPIEPRTSAFWGLGVEPTFEAFFPFYGEAALHVGVGMGVPIVRNDWHVTEAGQQVPLFRAASLRAIGFVGVAFGR